MDRKSGAFVPCKSSTEENAGVSRARYEELAREDRKEKIALFEKLRVADLYYSEGEVKLAPKALGQADIIVIIFEYLQMESGTKSCTLCMVP